MRFVEEVGVGRVRFEGGVGKVRERVGDKEEKMRGKVVDGDVMETKVMGCETLGSGMVN